MYHNDDPRLAGLCRIRCFKSYLGNRKVDWRIGGLFDEM